MYRVPPKCQTPIYALHRHYLSDPSSAPGNDCYIISLLWVGMLRLREAKNSVKGQQLVKSRAGMQTRARVRVRTLASLPPSHLGCLPSSSPTRAHPAHRCRPPHMSPAPSSCLSPATLQSSPACQAPQCSEDPSPPCAPPRHSPRDGTMAVCPSAHPFTPAFHSRTPGTSGRPGALETIWSAGF